MQTLAHQIEQSFRVAIAAAFNFDADPIITPAQNQTFGDYQSNAAMGLAKRLAKETGQKANPRQVAQQILAKLDLAAIAQDVSIAGPGFINIRLSPEFLANCLGTILSDPRLGIETTAQPQRVVVDYSGPNIAKEMHVGHLRSTIIGDAISRVLAFEGHDVIRQNHIGDWGTQFGKVVLAFWYLALAEKFGEAEVLNKEMDALAKPSATKTHCGKRRSSNGWPNSTANISMPTRMEKSPSILICGDCSPISSRS